MRSFWVSWFATIFFTATNVVAEKTIQDEETSNVDVAEAMSDLKVCGNMTS
jgi:hypothetical protein